MGAVQQAINPATGELIREFALHGPIEIAAVLAQAEAAQRAWRDTTLTDRTRLLLEVAAQLRHKRQDYARMMAEEMGKPVTAGLGEVDKCALVCEYYAAHAEQLLQDEVVASDARRSYVAFRPLGVLLAVMPWNFPFWQVFRCAAPALVAGNGLVLKHASNVPHCALVLEELFAEAGFPPGLFRTLLIDSDHVGDVIADPRVQAVTLTGSESAGRAVAAQAGQVLKKTVLELGGSDPFVVLDDADIAEAARVGARSRCINSGQSCIAAKRFVVQASVHDAFVAALQTEMEALVVGDPLAETTDIGPLARTDLRDTLQRQVDASCAQGARLLCGGAPLPGPGPGCFYPPTILADVAPGMPAYDEELFGPVAAVIRVADDVEAVQVANDTPFGLGGSVWTADSLRGETLASRIEAGAVFVNGLVKSDPRLPFGGVKASGYGRELAGYGLHEFVNIQTVWMR